MVTSEELLLETLEMLGNEDFEAFRWFLMLPGIYSGFTPIPRYKLQKAERMETVTLMVQTYSHHAVELAETVLGKMSMYDLVQKLSDRSSELKGNTWKDKEIILKTLNLDIKNLIFIS